MEDDVREALWRPAHVQPVEGRLNNHHFRQDKTTHQHSMFQTPALQAVILTPMKVENPAALAA